MTPLPKRQAPPSDIAFATFLIVLLLVLWSWGRP